MSMSTTTVAVQTTGALAARYIAETDAFLNEHWDRAFVRWPLKQDTGAPAGAHRESDASTATVDTPPAGIAPHPIASWTLLCLPTVGVEGESQGMTLRLVLVFREPEPPPVRVNPRTREDVWEMRLAGGPEERAMLGCATTRAEADEAKADDHPRLGMNRVTARVV